MGGRGNVTLFGVWTPSLSINMRGSGCAKLCGRVGVHSIKNSGRGLLNIVGVDTDSLSIWSSENSAIGMTGRAKLSKVYAQDKAQVYFYTVGSPSLSVYETGQAKVGLGGFVKTLHVDLANESQFQGRSLWAESAFVKTQGLSHANISAQKRGFVSAMDSSSIYFFGQKNILSETKTEQGAVVVMD